MLRTYWVLTLALTLWEIDDTRARLSDETDDNTLCYHDAIGRAEVLRRVIRDLYGKETAYGIRTDARKMSEERDWGQIYEALTKCRDFMREEPKIGE